MKMDFEKVQEAFTATEAEIKKHHLRMSMLSEMGTYKASQDRKLWVQPDLQLKILKEGNQNEIKALLKNCQQLESFADTKKAITLCPEGQLIIYVSNMSVEIKHFMLANLNLCLDLEKSMIFACEFLPIDRKDRRFSAEAEQYFITKMVENCRKADALLPSYAKYFKEYFNPKEMSFSCHKETELLILQKFDLMNGRDSLIDGMSKLVEHFIRVNNGLTTPEAQRQMLDVGHTEWIKTFLIYKKKLTDYGGLFFNRSLLEQFQRRGKSDEIELYLKRYAEESQVKTTLL